VVVLVLLPALLVVRLAHGRRDRTMGPILSEGRYGFCGQKSHG
jgi:hypothetical protein